VTTPPVDTDGPAVGPGHGPDVSVVIPLHNEARTLRELYQRVKDTMESLPGTWEMVLVNDGSTDATPGILDELHACDSRVVVVHLRRNYGQTPALMAGFDHALGEYIVAMDGDLQYAPEEIPNFLEKINEGYDLVSGWRLTRSDALLTRTIPSRIANWLIAKVSGVRVHDFGTTFKAYRRDVLADLHLYGELHRFVPALSPCTERASSRFPSRTWGATRENRTTGFRERSGSCSTW